MRLRRVFFLIVVVLVIAAGWWGFRLYSWTRSNSLPYIYDWFRNPEVRPQLSTHLTEPCPGAPFLLPSSGLVGLLYADPAAPYNAVRRHTGLDIFGDGAPGAVPIVAAYDGWLSRLPSWRSTVIIRHEDPLREGRIIWTYYTHMASRDGTIDFIHPDFPRGTSEVPVTQGQVIGWQGEYGGNLSIGLHLHFSIVKSAADGSFENESILVNTLDPSPYLGIDLNALNSPRRPVTCD
ncbi:MAG: M23 family metallopeptidase [Chloroflexota bacterium]